MSSIQISVREPGLTWLSQARILLRKDLIAELRTRVAINSVGLFAFASLMLIALATRGLNEIQSIMVRKLPLSNISLSDVDRALLPAWSNTSKMGLLWTLLCFAAFAGLGHSFVHEEEAGTVTALRLSMSPNGVFAGKLAFNVMLVIGIAVLVTPPYMLLTGLQAGGLLPFLSVMISGCFGLAGAATIVAALASKAKGSGALFGAIGLPIITVLLILLMNAARTLYDQTSTLQQTVKDTGGLISFGVLLVSISFLTFQYVWED